MGGLEPAQQDRDARGALSWGLPASPRAAGALTPRSLGGHGYFPSVREAGASFSSHASTPASG